MSSCDMGRDSHRLETAPARVEASGRRQLLELTPSREFNELSLKLLSKLKFWELEEQLLTLQSREDRVFIMRPLVEALPPALVAVTVATGLCTVLARRG